VASAEDDRAQRRVDFVDEARFDKSAVDFASAFAEQAFDLPFLAQPAQRGGKINFALAADFHFIGERAETPQFCGGRASSGQDDDGRETVLEDFGVGIERARAADHDAEVVFREAGAETLTAVFHTAGAELDGREVHRARAGHDGVRGGAEFEEMFLVAAAAEGDEMARGGRELAVGRGGDVQKDKGQRAAGFHWPRMLERRAKEKVGLDIFKHLFEICV
jgi:hypothetical protein